MDGHGKEDASIITFVVHQVLFIAQIFKEFFENNKGDNRADFPNRAGEGAQHYFRHGPSRSLVRNKRWSRVASCVSYHGAKHHEGRLSKSNPDAETLP